MALPLLNTRTRPLPALLWALLTTLLCSTAALLPAAQAQAAAPGAKPVAAKPLAAKSARPAKSAAKSPVTRTELKNKAISLALATQTAEAISQGQLDVASRVLIGDIDCEFNQRISVTPVDDMPGYFNLTYQRKRYRMLPRETSTGAVRLEDPDAGIVWLQIPAKSMLMNTRIGQRLVDACLHAMQRPGANGVTVASEGIGIAPMAAAMVAPAASGSAVIEAGTAATASAEAASATAELRAPTIDAAAPGVVTAVAATVPAAPAAVPATETIAPAVAAAASAAPAVQPR